MRFAREFHTDSPANLKVGEWANTVARVTVPTIAGARVRSRRGGAAWQVAVPRVHVLQQLAVTSVGLAAVRELDVTVARWRPPLAGWTGRPALPGVRAFSIEAGDGGVRLSIAMLEPIDVALLLAAAVRCLRPSATGDLGPMLTFGPGLPPAAAPLAGRLHDVLVEGEQCDPHVRRCDVLVAPLSGTLPDVGRAHAVVIADGSWTRDGTAFEVVVDPTVHRPIGRRSTGATEVAHGAVAAGVLTISTASGPVVVTGDVSGANSLALRRTLAVVCEGLPRRWSEQLRACGVVVADASVPLPDAADDLSWQCLSVVGRRDALRESGPTAALDAWPTVSVVLVTHRPDHLEGALRQVGALRYPRLEVVLGIHGDRIDGARAWELAQEIRHPVTMVALDSALTLGEALQACCNRAEGALVTKMDDDDVYGPEHVWDLVLAREYSGAQVVGKALDWIHLESEDATVFRPVYGAEKYADFVAGGTMLISRADLNAVGGWRPVPKSVDRALLDRVLADGGLVYRTHGLGYVYARHSSGHTASVSDEHFLTRTRARYPGLMQHPEFGTAGASRGPS